MMAPQDKREGEDLFAAPRILIPGKVWVGSKEVAAALGIGALGLDEIRPNEWKARGIRAHLNPAFNIVLRYHVDMPALRLLIDDHDTVAPAVFDLAVAVHRLHGRATFVSCNSGKNRSVAFACALGVSEGLALEECFRLLNAPTPELEASLRAWAGVGA